MASITIRNLDDETKARLRLQAARHQRSMEEARTMLREALAVSDVPPLSLAAAIRRRFQAFGGVELDLPARASRRPT